MADYRVSTNTNNSNKTTTKQTMDQLRLFKLIQDLLKIPVGSQTACEGQGLKEQLNVVKLRMFRVGTQMPTVSRVEGQCSAPLKTNTSKEMLQIYYMHVVLYGLH
jgi:hypothetical protein